MAGWGTVTVGGIAFREELTVEESGDGTLKISGQESSPPSTHLAVKAAHANIPGLRGYVGAVTFSDKVELSGFYEVTDATSTFYQFAGTSQLSASWSMTLRRIGSERDVEMESRVPTIGRADNLAGTQVPVFWHAPPPAVTSYYTGLTTPAGSATRASEDGTVTAYTGIPADVAPRWTVPASGYLAASARLLVDGIRRAGEVTPAGTSWEMSNGIIKVSSSANGFAVSVWSGSWTSSSTYYVQIAGVTLSGTPELTILRNEPGEAGIRLTYPGAPGRVTVDLSLRRGARFVTGVIKRHSAASLTITRGSTDTITRTEYGVRQVNADTAGNRYLMGTSRSTATSDLAWSYIQATAAATSFDFFLGYEVGATPGAGNTFAELLLQYLGTTNDTTRVIER